MNIQSKEKSKGKGIRGKKTMINYTMYILFMVMTIL